jgi:hypothetical protein
MKTNIVSNVLSALSISLMLNGCSNVHKEVVVANHKHSMHHTERDIREETINKETLPSFLENKDQKIKQIYKIVAHNADLLKYIPCFCGCGESVGHTSNLDCFISQIKSNGAVVWNSHAINCNNCLEIAFEAAKLKQDGKTPLEIRKYIDNKYKDSYTKPTKTPMPN